MWRNFSAIPIKCGAVVINLSRASASWVRPGRAPWTYLSYKSFWSNQNKIRNRFHQCIDQNIVRHKSSIPWLSAKNKIMFAHPQKVMVIKKTLNFCFLLSSESYFKFHLLRLRSYLEIELASYSDSQRQEHTFRHFISPNMMNNPI